MINIYKKYEQIINYLIVGGATTIVSISSYFLFTKVFNLNYMLSTILSFICAVLFSFIANKRIVFKSNNNYLKELISFVSCRLVSLGIEMISMFVLVDLIKINDGISKIIVQFIVLTLNYIFSKLFVFKEKSRL